MTKVNIGTKEVTSEWEPQIELVEAIVRNIQPKLSVDIGTHHGVSAISLGSFTPGKVVTIDEQKLFTGELGENIEFREGDSKDIKKLHPNCETIDILHIDGDHSLEGVMADIENWTPFVDRDKGIIMIHDVTNFSFAGFGPIRAFNSINDKGLFKVVQNAGNGLGILTYNRDFINEVIVGRQDIATLQWLNAVWVDYSVGQLDGLLREAGVEVK